MGEASVDQFAEAVAANRRLVAGVAADQWPAPTPCAGWTVRDLVNHVVVGNRLFADVMTGRAASIAEARQAWAGDRLGADPVAAYQEAAEAAVAAFRRPGALAEPVALSFGSVPGPVALHLRIVETLVHGWDLARATGQPPEFPDDVVEQEIQFSRTGLEQLPLPREDGPFAPPQPVDPAAPALDRLAALLGRPIDPA
jgi:uncharacterized protein (TIGR03086 family)